MKKRMIKEIDGENVVAYNFGVKKDILQHVATANELKKFKSLVDEKRRIRMEAWLANKRYPNYRDINPIDSELRGYRLWWRTKYTNSFNEGLYKATKTLRYEVGKCQGEFGVCWLNSVISKNTLFMYVRHDPLDNVELMNLSNNQLIKIKRGSASSESFTRVIEEENCAG